MPIRISKLVRAVVAITCGAGCGALPERTRPINLASGLWNQRCETPGIDGVRIQHFVTDQGVVDQPADLRNAAIGAWVRTSNNEFTYYAGMGDVGGHFCIPDVPDGLYYLQFDSTYLHTESRGLDLSEYVPGRPNVALASQGTTLNLDLAGMSPWNFVDDLTLVSSNAGLAFIVLEAYDYDPLHFPNLGDTAYTQRTDYARYRDPRLIDATQGDSAVLFQLVTQHTGEIDYGAAGKVLTSSDLTMVDGATSELSGTLTDVAQDHSQPLLWRFSSFHAYGSAIHPSAILAEDDFYIDVLPGGTSWGPYPRSIADLVQTFVDPGTADQNFTFTYGDPFPKSAGRFATGLSFYRTRYSLPLPSGGTTSLFAPGFLRTDDELSNFPTDPFEVQLSPPRDLTVDGQAATGDLDGIGTTPEVQWGAPAEGQPTHYVLQLFELFVDAMNQAQRRLAGRLYTMRTSIQVPPEILEERKHYYFQLTAVYSPGTNVERAPYLRRFPESTADALTGILSP